MVMMEDLLTQGHCFAEPAGVEVANKMSLGDDEMYNGI
jgi:hypothetical protein